MMSKKKQNQENEPIYSFQKNATEKVRIQFSEFNRRKLLDIRVYYKVPETSNEWKPCKKGICMSVDHLGDLLKGLKMAHERLKKEDKAGNV